MLAKCRSTFNGFWNLLGGPGEPDSISTEFEGSKVRGAKKLGFASCASLTAVRLRSLNDT